MENKQREQIYYIVKHFEGKKPTDEEVAKFCEEKGYTLISADYLTDYTFQVKHDEMEKDIVAEILEELRLWVSVPEFAPEKDREKAQQQNEKVMERVAKVMEKYPIPYVSIEGFGNTLGNEIGSVVAQAGNTISNKAKSVLLYIGREKCGSEFNTKFASQYLEQVYKEAEKENKKKEPISWYKGVLEKIKFLSKKIKE